MSGLDKKDALLFERLCKFIWEIKGSRIPLVYNIKEDIYRRNGITFGVVKHLDSIGLISFEALAGYKTMMLNKIEKIKYQKVLVILEFTKDKDNEMGVGHILLTNAGGKLSTICKPVKVDGFVDYVLQECKRQGIKV